MENKTRYWHDTYHSCEDIAFEITEQILGCDSREDVFGIICHALHHVDGRARRRARSLRGGSRRPRLATRRTA